jgi:iron complex outermembrane receptor protein
MPARFRQNRAEGSGSNAMLSMALQRGDYLFTTGVDGRFAEHHSVITNPNNPAFEIQNFADVRRDLVSAFAVVNTEIGSASWEAGLRYSHVATEAGEVSANGMMPMMGMNAEQLARRFNAADRSRTFDNVDAVVKFAWQFSPQLRAGFDIGSKTRAPSYQELYLWLPLQATGGLADGRNYIGNLDLESERSAEVAVSLDWTGERLAISPQAYYKRVDNYIQGVPAELMPANMLASIMTGSPALMFDNVDAEIYGVDVGWQYRLTPTLRLEGNAAYVRGRRADLDDNLYRLPPVNGSIALRYARDALSLRAEVVGYGGQDKVAAYNDEQESAGYGLFNASMAWQVGDALRLEFQASNIFDRGYQDHLAGVNRDRDVDIPAGERLWGESRTLTVGAVVSF